MKLITLQDVGLRRLKQAWRSKTALQVHELGDILRKCVQNSVRFASPDTDASSLSTQMSEWTHRNLGKSKAAPPGPAQTAWFEEEWSSDGFADSVPCMIVIVIRWPM